MKMKTILGGLAGIVLVLAIIYIYCLPSIIAGKRKHKNKTPISLLNFFLGWTFLGWVIALIWSFSAQETKV